MDPIHALRLPDLPGRYLNAINEEVLTELTELSRVNIFVGANNSGKSRLLRHLAILKAYDVRFCDGDAATRTSAVSSQLGRVKSLLRNSGLSAFGKVSIENIEKAESDLLPYVRLGNDVFAPAKAIFESAAAAQRGDPPSIPPGQQQAPGFNAKALARELNKVGEECKGTVASLPAPIPAPKRWYIPTLRGLRPLKDGDTLFHDRTKKDYFTDLPENLRTRPGIFTGATIYSQLRDLMLGVKAERRTVESYEAFLSDTFFDGQDVEITPHSKSDTVMVKIGHERDQPIYRLGDGIQQAITLTFLPFTSSEPTVFFVEEPEVHMHPGMQRKLLNFLTTHPVCKVHHFFLTTHSNHLLDMTADYDQIAVLNFRKRFPLDDADEKDPEYLVEPVEAGDERTLQLLGVRNSSVFLVNATIWVEGITDRLYLRRFLALYREAMKNTPGFVRLEEDVHYSIVEYGGSNIDHWSWLENPDPEKPSITVERLCAKVFVLVDQDAEGSKKERKEKLRAKLTDDRFAMLPAREIENALPMRVIYEVVRHFEKNEGLKPLAGLTDHRQGALGDFIHEKILSGHARRKGGYREKSGTVKYKPGFCDRALEHLTSYEELDPKVQELVAKIYGFVKRQNS